MLCRVACIIAEGQLESKMSIEVVNWFMINSVFGLNNRSYYIKKNILENGN